MLVFLIKNVSMDAANITTPENMTFPFSIQNEKLIEDADPLVIKMYPTQILMGKDNARIGSLEDLTDDAKYRTILAVLEHEAELISKRDMNTTPVMLIQADKSVTCSYISEMMRLAGEGGYQYVYFSSTENKAWLTEYAKGM
jgi:biopolymer transport protein ExbD